MDEKTQNKMSTEIVLSTTPKNESGFKPGQRGYFINKDNQLVIIGENDEYVYTILDSNGSYYGIWKKEENLSALHGL
jgi:hypothetical protein